MWDIPVGFHGHVLLCGAVEHVFLDHFLAVRFVSYHEVVHQVSVLMTLSWALHAAICLLDFHKENVGKRAGNRHDSKNLCTLFWHLLSEVKPSCTNWYKTHNWLTENSNRKMIINNNPNSSSNSLYIVLWPLKIQLWNGTGLLQHTIR